MILQTPQSFVGSTNETADEIKPTMVNNSVIVITPEFILYLMRLKAQSAYPRCEGHFSEVNDYENISSVEDENNLHARPVEEYRDPRIITIQESLTSFMTKHNIIMTQNKNHGCARNNRDSSEMMMNHTIEDRNNYDDDDRAFNFRNIAKTLFLWALRIDPIYLH